MGNPEILERPNPAEQKPQKDRTQIFKGSRQVGHREIQAGHVALIQNCPGAAPSAPAQGGTGALTKVQHHGCVLIEVRPSGRGAQQGGAAAPAQLDRACSGGFPRSAISDRRSDSNEPRSLASRAV